METFIKLLATGDREKAQAVLASSNQEELRAIIAYFVDLVKKETSFLHIEPKTISILRRTLKPGKTYDDFVAAWLPTDVEKESDYFDIPAQVVNAYNLRKEGELLSIGIVSADERQVMESSQKYQEREAARRERIAKVAEGELLGFYKVLDVVTLGK